jgi:hypothetical protein
MKIPKVEIEGSEDTFGIIYTCKINGKELDTMVYYNCPLPIGVEEMIARHFLKEIKENGFRALD